MLNESLYEIDEYGATCRTCDAWTADGSVPCRCEEKSANVRSARPEILLDSSHITVWLCKS